MCAVCASKVRPICTHGELHHHFITKETIAATQLSFLQCVCSAKGAEDHILFVSVLPAFAFLTSRFLCPELFFVCYLLTNQSTSLFCFDLLPRAKALLLWRSATSPTKQFLLSLTFLASTIKINLKLFLFFYPDFTAPLFPEKKFHHTREVVSEVHFFQYFQGGLFFFVLFRTNTFVVGNDSNVLRPFVYSPSPLLPSPFIVHSLICVVQAGFFLTSISVEGKFLSFVFICMA